MKKIDISVSTNPPKVEELIDYIAQMNCLDVDLIHCDIMDGKFVENKTFDYKKVKEIRKCTNLPLDVHLMTSSVSNIKKYIKAGANIVSLHFEIFSSTEKLIKTLMCIGKVGIQAGLAINPDTEVEKIFPIIPYCNSITIMSVVPGKSGQKFMPESLEKIKAIRKYSKSLGISDLTIEVDGGINDKNITDIISAGANRVVVGNYIYSAKDRSLAVEKLRDKK